ncbi:MAG: 4-demethylwyosine synthase TYW1 [Zestosphaera sp.]
MVASIRRALRLPVQTGEADPYTMVMNRLKNQKYHLIGSHSAVKKCLWVHNALTQGRFCYKCKFYGIESHRCVQFTPSTLWCWNACLHCWRVRPQDLGLKEEDLIKIHGLDDPDIIADLAIEEHRRIVSGYKHMTSKEMWSEAMNPKHVAISLTGEPTLYSRLGELIQAYHRRGLTTFLVTRGIRPEVLASLEDEPTQLYVSLEAWSKEMYSYFNRPLVSRGWEKTLKTLEILPSFSSPTVIRITLVKGFNMGEKDVKGFAKLIDIASPTYVEPKAYMHVGGSTDRLSRDNMPSMNEVLDFASKLAEESGYRLVSHSTPSRVALLTKLSKPAIRYGKGCPEAWCSKEIGDEFSGEYGAAEL